MSLINPGDFPIDANVVDGTELAARLNRLKLAIYSGLSNGSRPADVTAGGIWSRNDGGGNYTIMLFDGTADHAVGTLVDGEFTSEGGMPGNVVIDPNAPDDAIVVGPGGDVSFIGVISHPAARYFVKADRESPVFIKKGAGAMSIKAGTILSAANGSTYRFDAEAPVTMPALAAGTDYAIYIDNNGALLASANFALATNSYRKLGGFHYAPGGHSGAPGGGNTAQQINEYSIWDNKFRPAAKDPRGMALVAGAFWSDIYLTGVDAITNGSSRYNVTIADGASPPKIPTAFGGNGSASYSSYTWWEASEIAKSQGKRLPTYGEFGALAFGTTEKVSRGTDPVNTIWEPPYISKWGVCQATGNLWSWGDEFSYRQDGGAPDWAWRTGHTNGRGDLYLYNDFGLVAALFGGYWDHTSNSGSRSSNWDSYPWYSSNNISARLVCDHLIHD